MKTIRLLALASAAVSLAAAASAVTLTFGSDADYDNNFVELAASGDSTLSTFAFASPSTERSLRKTGTGTQSALYNTSATGGSGGSGGTSGTPGNNLFGDVSVSADFRISAFNTPSLGLWSRVNSAGTSGYLGLVNLISSTSVQLRVFDSNANPGGSGVGTALFNQTFTLTEITLNTSTFYTASLSTITSGTDVTFILELKTTGGVSIASTGIVTDTSSPVLADGQVGFRAASSTLYIDNFSVAAIPEPSSAAALAGLLVIGGALLRRRR